MILYYFVYIIGFGIAKLPLPIAYLFSDVLYFISYYFIRYRKKVVRNNIQIAFPEKSFKERIKIEKEFYQYFSDLLIELIQMMSISKSEMLKRCEIDDLSILESYLKQGRKIIAISAHLGNWDYGVNCISLLLNYEVHAAYRPLNNKRFDELMYKLRGQFGVKLVPLKQILRTILKKRDLPTVNFFLSDQSPAKHEINYWTTFFGKKVPFYTGPEKIAMADSNSVVFFVNMSRLKRGYYKVNIQLISDDVTKVSPGEITEKNVQLLEDAIRKNPSHWLWSHRRWKHSVAN